MIQLWKKKIQFTYAPPQKKNKKPKKKNKKQKDDQGGDKFFCVLRL